MVVGRYIHNVSIFYQRKESRLKKTAKRRQAAEKQHRKNRSREAVYNSTAAQKAEESRRKIESGSIEQLRVAESRKETQKLDWRRVAERRQNE